MKSNLPAKFLALIVVVGLVGLTLAVFSAESRAVNEEVSHPIKRHIDDERDLRLKREADEDEEPKSHHKKKHHSGSKKHTTTTSKPESSDGESKSTTKAPKSNKHHSTTKKSKGRKTALRSGKHKSTSTTEKPQDSTKTKKSDSSPTTTTTKEPDSESEKSTKASKPVHLRSAARKSPSKRKRLEASTQRWLQQQERTALDHLLAGVYDWSKVLRQTKGKTLNKVASGEVLLMFEEIKKELNKADKPDKLVRLYKELKQDTD